jgi:hypothetical protein
MFEQENRGLAVWLDFEQQRLVAERCTWVPGFGWGRFVLDQMGHANERRVIEEVDLELPGGEWLGLRVMLRDRYMEAYLDDRWLLTLDTADQPRSGRVELAVERGAAQFRALSVASLPPLADAVQQLAPR